MSWGVGYFGQLGHGDDSSWENPRMVSALDPRRLGATVISVACGGSHSGAITESNKVFMWGLNRGGQCGTNSKADSILEPKPIDSTELTASMKISSLVCGRNHTAALTSLGRVFVWGEATFGRLGFADGRKRQAHPTEMVAFRSLPVAGLASGDFHMLALTQGGSVYSWGYGSDGQTGQRSLMNVKVPRCVDQLEGLGVTAVHCGASWSVAITSRGHMYAWGYGDGGWLGIRPPTRMVSLDCDHTSPDQQDLAQQHAHATSFDSRHNVLCPQLVRFLAEDWQVDRVRAGGAHMVMLCSARTTAAAEDAVAAVSTRQPGAHLTALTIESVADSRSHLLGSRSSPRSDASEGSNGSESTSKSSPRFGLPSVGTATDDAQLISWSRHKKLSELADALGRGANVNVVDSAGNTPLIVACQTGHLQVCEMLLRFGANLNRANLKGNTPLHYALNYGYEDIGAWLVAQGADEYAVNNVGLTCYEGLTREELDLI